MHLKHRLLAVGLGVVLSLPVFAQVVSIDPFTGDAWIDTRINTYGDYWRDDRGFYLDNMQDRFGYDRNWYEDRLSRGDLSAADLYYACSLARATGRSCQSVLDDRREFASRGQGWGAMAKRYGIKPGSAEFHRMKSSMQQDDDRWHGTARDRSHDHQDDHRSHQVGTAVNDDHAPTGGRADHGNGKAHHGKTHSSKGHKESGGNKKNDKPHKKSHSKGHGGH